WEPLWQGYLAFYGVPLPDAVTDTTWTRLLDPDWDVHGLVAANDESGKMLGIVHFLFHPVTWAIAPRCYLEDLFVAELARGTGAGRRLIEGVYEEADARGADQVYWLTEDDNQTARRLYDRVGRHTRFIKYQR
ncbi:MAG: GNAT family N-acetyltransferase, partial [Myxococcota bacterium]